MTEARAPDHNSANLAFLAAGGEMGRRMRAHDWASSPLGPPERWPQSLKTIVRVMLDSRYAMWMAWGPELTFFCNDAYLPTVGIKREWVLGRRSDEVWKEIWSDIGPRIDHVLKSGEATWDEGLLLFLERSGFAEETYHTFSYSPVYDDQSRVAGMLCVVTEVTDRVIGERRLRGLRDLAAQAGGVDDVIDSTRRAMDVLERYAIDVPFAALYLVEPGDDYLRRVAVSRDLPEHWFAPRMPLAPEPDPWQIGALGSTRKSQDIDLMSLGLVIDAAPWSEAVKRAVALPLLSGGQERLVGILVAGVSPRRVFDDAYRSFLDLVAGQLASVIANAQAYEAERERAKALSEIDRAKTAFFSNVSHEFRTPLTLMIGPVEDMIADAAVPDAARERLNVVHRNSMRLQKLVNSLLEFSRIEAGRVQASYVPTDLAALTRDLVSTFGSALELAGVALRTTFETLSAPVFVDRDMWEKVVLNLLSNAFKFTMQGEIDVRLTEEPGEVVLTVRDTGIGIAPDALPRLFERFYRVEGAEGRTHEGSGIGLALVHELVGMHGGRVDVASELARGTTFTIRLPLGHDHLPAERVRPAQSLHTPVVAARAYVQEALRWLPESAITPDVDAARDARVAEQRAHGVAQSVEGARILVADDNADMRAYVRDLLAPHYAVEVVADGRAALEAARQRAPDLVISDVMMPRMDGFALLRELRADDVLRDVPTILLSARAGEEAVIEGLDAMANDYLVKPFSARELLARVGAQLQLARLRRESQRALADRTAQFETLFNEAPLGVYLVDADFRVRDMNPIAQAVFGARESLLGRDYDEVIHTLWPKTYADEIVRLFRHTLATGEPYFAGERIELRLDRRTTEYYEWRIGRIPLPDGRFGVVCYFRDISAHVHARVALENADRQKNEFLAMLAHELRNPLAPIRNAAELLTRTVPADSRIHDLTAMVARQVTQLTRLVDDLLDVSRITQNRVELRRHPLDLGGVVGRAIETVNPLFDDKRQKVSIAHSAELLHVDGDMERLVQCVVNVLTNAAKYTDAGGTINVTTRADGGSAVIDVTDSGVGISPELLPRIFDLFVQGDRTLDRSLGGLGIGLSVAKRLVDMHGGTMTARSPGLGQGSTFEIRLPLIERPQQAAVEVATPAGAPKRVLVVDDNADAADSLMLVLKLDGHVVESVYSARDALDRAPSFKADIVLLDIGLPEIDGYEVARNLRVLPGMDNVRVIALSGYGQTEDLRRAREAGFDDYLVKPVDFDALQRAMTGTSGAAFAPDDR